jgi:ubiquinone biosynthesis monooxygenase Coq7
LKVNHAGEYGAIRIYRAQLWMSKRFFPDLVGFLEETLEHEIQHCALFREAMPSREARPCRIMTLWGNGGWALGLTTALLGRQAIWICTAAVENTVHRHLDDQLRFLADRDRPLDELIRSIQSQELGHLNHAEAHIATSGAWSRILRATISGVTDAVIWLSTWGDSTRMTRELAFAEDSAPRDGRHPR